MPTDFTRLFTRSTSLVAALRRITYASVMAATGLSTAAFASVLPKEAPIEPTQSVTAAIVNRSKKAAKFVLQLPGAAAYMVSEHRSHRSHSSHRSHYSAAGGGGSSAPAPTTPRPAVPAVTPATANSVSGQVESINKEKRTFVVKVGTLRHTFGYRDDTKYTGVSGVSLRFDEYSKLNGLPISVGHKVKVQWRTATTQTIRIATAIEPDSQ